MVSANTTGARSLTSIAQEVQRQVGRKVQLPTGYFVVYGGQYEAQSQASRQMLLLGLAATALLLLVFFLWRRN